MKKMIISLVVVFFAVQAVFSDSLNVWKSSFGFFTEITTGKALRSGAIGDGARSQNNAKFTYGLLSLSGWLSYRIPEEGRGNEEFDLVLQFQSPWIITSVGKFRWNINGETFTFFQNPSYNILVAEAGLTYENFVNVKIDFLKMLNGPLTADRNMGHVEICKSVRAQEFVVTPFVNTAYLQNFYGTNGFSKIRVGLKTSYDISDNMLILASSAYQFGFNGKPSKPYATLRFSTFF